MRDYDQVIKEIKHTRNIYSILSPENYVQYYVDLNKLFNEFTNLLTQDSDLFNILERPQYLVFDLLTSQKNFIEKINQWTSYFHVFLDVTKTTINIEENYIRVGEAPTQIGAKQSEEKSKLVSLISHIETSFLNLIYRISFIQNRVEHKFECFPEKEYLLSYLTSLSEIISVNKACLLFLRERKKEKLFGYMHYFEEIGRLYAINEENFEELSKEDKAAVKPLFQVNLQTIIMDAKHKYIQELKKDIKDEKSYSLSFLTLRSKFLEKLKNDTFFDLDAIKKYFNQFMDEANNNNLTFLKLDIYFKILSNIVERLEILHCDKIVLLTNDSPIAKSDAIIQFALEIIADFYSQEFKNSLAPLIKDSRTMRSIHYFLKSNSNYVEFIELTNKLLIVLIRMFTVVKQDSLYPLLAKVMTLLKTQKNLLLFYKEKFAKETLPQWIFLDSVGKICIWNNEVFENSLVKGLSIKQVVNTIESILIEYKNKQAECKKPKLVTISREFFTKVVVNYYQLLAKDSFGDDSSFFQALKKIEYKNDRSFSMTDLETDTIFENEPKPVKPTDKSSKNKKNNKKNKLNKKKNNRKGDSAQPKKSKMSVVSSPQVIIEAKSPESAKMCKLYVDIVKAYEQKNHADYEKFIKLLEKFASNKNETIKLEAIAKLADVHLEISHKKLIQIDFKKDPCIALLHNTLKSLENSRKYIFYFEYLISSRPMDSSLSDTCRLLLSVMKQKVTVNFDTPLQLLDEKLRELEKSKQQKFKERGMDLFIPKSKPSIRTQQEKIIRNVIGTFKGLDQFRKSLSNRFEGETKSSLEEKDLPSLPYASQSSSSSSSLSSSSFLSSSSSSSSSSSFSGSSASSLSSTTKPKKCDEVKYQDNGQVLFKSVPIVTGQEDQKPIITEIEELIKGLGLSENVKYGAKLNYITLNDNPKKKKVEDLKQLRDLVKRENPHLNSAKFTFSQ